MKFVRSFYRKKALSVLDVGSREVTAITAERQSDGSFRVLGAGHSRLAGIAGGRVLNFGDAAESIVDAARAAQAASGIRPDKIYFNLDDTNIESVTVCGSKSLAGEGEIRHLEVDEAKTSAERLMRHFEKSLVYSKPVRFVIDDRDVVSDPIGVFGRKLEVWVYLVQARSAHCDAWQRLMRRAGYAKAVPVLSAWSTALGILSREDRGKKNLILDLSRDFSNLFIFTGQGITELRLSANGEASAHVIFERAKGLAGELLEKNPGINQVFLTGELAAQAEQSESLENCFPASPRLGLPIGVPGLHVAAYASAAGLLHAAHEIEKKTSPTYRDKDLVSAVKDQTASFIREYF